MKYYRIIFSNKQEYFIESEQDTTDAFIQNMRLEDGFIKLNREDTNSLYIMGSAVFSIQEVNKGSISSMQTKLWRLN